MILLAGLIGTATGAVTPLWIQHATSGGDLAGVVISADDSTIIVGGDQVISLTREGQNRWTGWSSSHLAISRDGDYILTSQGPILRLISSAGTLIWDQSMEIPITDISIDPNASIIAATGGGRLRTVTLAGEGIASNTTLSVNHLRIMPSGRQVLLTTSKDVQLTDLTLKSTWSDANATQDLIAVAPDGSSFVTATNNRIRMYRGDGNLTWDKKFSSDNAQALAWSRDRSTIVIGTDHNNVLVLNRDGAPVWSANATNWITSVAVSGDGNTIVAGSLDKKIYVFNHAGSRLGTFTTKSAIRFNSVAVTGDGSLIVVVDSSAAYGLLRSSFTEPVSATGTIAETTPETTEETPAIPVTGTTSRRSTSRTPALPTPYPEESATPESPVPAAVPLLALGFLLLCRRVRK
jgi:WD40 repeat protein